MSLSSTRKSANAYVAHVHFASNSTAFNISYCDVAKQNVLHCENDARNQTCELFIGNNTQLVSYIAADLTKLGYTQF